MAIQVGKPFGKIRADVLRALKAYRDYLLVAGIPVSADLQRKCETGKHE
jgi:hypothetical protein